MAWGRLHDGANGDDKLLALSDGAFRLWACGIIYAQRNRTDGFLPKHAVETFPVRYRPLSKLIAELTAVLVPGKSPLWERAEGGYQIHDFLDWNDSRESVESQRESTRRRVALFRNAELTREVRDRDGDHCRYCGQQVNWHDRRGPTGATYDHVDPHGPNKAENLVVACRSCNSKKGGRSLRELGWELNQELDQKQVPIQINSQKSQVRSNSGVVRGSVRTYVRTSQGEQNVDQASFETTGKESPLDERAGEFLDWYYETYPKLRRGARIRKTAARDFPTVLELCATWDNARLRQMAELFLQTDHEFAEKGSRTVGQFAGLASWCDDRLRQHGK